MTTAKLDIENYVDGSYKPHTKKMTWKKGVVEQSEKEEKPDLDARTEAMLENLALATDKWEAAIAMQPEAI